MLFESLAFFENLASSVLCFFGDAAAFEGASFRLIPPISRVAGFASSLLYQKVDSIKAQISCWEEFLELRRRTFSAGFKTPYWFGPRLFTWVRALALIDNRLQYFDTTLSLTPKILMWIPRATARGLEQPMEAILKALSEFKSLC